jgi:hypothetical protein
MPETVGLFARLMMTEPASIKFLDKKQIYDLETKSCGISK